MISVPSETTPAFNFAPTRGNKSLANEEAEAKTIVAPVFVIASETAAVNNSGLYMSNDASLEK